MRKRLLIAIALLLCWCGAAAAMDVQRVITHWPTTRKIHVSNAGTDAATCGKISSPCATMNYARQFIRSGRRDRLLLARGSVYREQYELVDRQYLGPYGTGAMPKITGADPLANASFSLTSGQTYTYQISLPSIPTVWDKNHTFSRAMVMMVWDNNTRLGTATSKKTSIAQVEAAAGSFWWDGTNKILYIHPADNTSPITNGRTYEASVRMHCIHGGNGSSSFAQDYLVERMHCEKSYSDGLAYATYTVDGTGRGRFYKVVAKFGFNHLIGTAGSHNHEGEMLFENCLAEDSEYQTSPTNFVAYREGTALSHVRFKNCIAKQPSVQTGTIGFFSHGGTIHVTYENINVENMAAGVTIEAASGSSYATVAGNSHIFINVNNPIKTGQATNFTGVRISGGSATGIDSRFAGNTFNDVWIIGKTGGYYLQPYATTNLSNSYLVSSGTRIGILPGTSAVNTDHVTYYDLATAVNLNGGTANITGDYNTFWSNSFDFQDTYALYPGQPHRTLAQWQSVSGKEQHSTAPSTAPTLPVGIDSIAIPNVIGE